MCVFESMYMWVNIPASAPMEYMHSGSVTFATYDDTWNLALSTFHLQLEFSKLCQKIIKAKKEI